MVVYRHVDIPDGPGRIGLDDVILESGSCNGAEYRFRLPVPENIMPADAPDCSGCSGSGVLPAHAGAGCPGRCRKFGACPV